MMKQFARASMAAMLSALMTVGTLPSASAQEAPQNPPAPQSTSAVQRTPISLGMSKYNYSRAPKAFPNLIAPYTGGDIASSPLTNSPKIEQLIHDGKLELSLQDAIELALQNSMDIEVARYNVWFADTDLLRTAAGGVGRGTSGASFPFSQANLNSVNLDPTFTSTISIDSQLVPVNNPFLSGTGLTTTSVAGLPVHTNTYDFGVSQGFTTGTTASIAWNNTRSSSGSTFNSFNPSVQSALYLNVQQQLLNGFGTFVNRRNIVIAKNNRKIADLAFSQQVITTVTSAITAYYELAYARANVNVQQQAVTVAEKLYNDNKKQLEIGTMAPLDVTRAESELATDRQNLIVAQTAQLQQQQALRNAISKDPMAPNLVNVEIIPTDKPTPPAVVEAASFEDAVREAFGKRPDLLEAQINLTNAGIDAKANKKALLPTATLTARYGSQGLAGNSSITTTTAIAGSQIVGANGQAILVDSNGNAVPIFEPATSTTVTGTRTGGLGDAQSQIFHNQFPDYYVGLNVNIPIRNRVAQADYQHAVLTQRQTEAQLQGLKNAAILDVRNTYIALVQDRARVEAAGKARELQQQTFEAEQKKYQLGASTVYNVILTQRDFITAQGTELRAMADLVEAKANYERALGRTLEVNNVTIADARSGSVEKDTLIPGTLNGKVVGTDALFKRLDNASAASTGANAGQK
jgi:outer membrane protein TolC